MQVTISRQSAEAATAFVKKIRKVLIDVKIQKKLFLIITANIFAFVLIGILANYLLLEKFFLYKSKKEFITMSLKIQEYAKNNPKNIKQYITRYGKKENIRIILFNSDLGVDAVSYYQRNKNTNIPINKVKQLLKSKKNNDYVYKIYRQNRTSSSKIFFLYQTSNNKYILLTKSTKGVQESAAIANEFYLIIGFIVLAAGLSATAFFSNKLTKPIIQMNEVTKEMAKLHFEQKLPEKGTDEIAELAQNINHMSVQLHDSISMLELDLQRRKQLIRDLSHELKTPIAVIKGYADGLRYGIADDMDTTEKYCRIISEECSRMDRMVKDLLELSRLEQCALSPKLERIPLYEMAEKLSLKYSRDIEQKACTFSILGEKTVAATADKKLLERIIDNLLGNAVKYADAHGQISVMLDESQTETTFAVFNTGTAIPESQSDNIWNVFFKLDESRKRERDGHGIGLAIVKSAVELHHGTVFVQNQKNGVIFGCSFPKI